MPAPTQQPALPSEVLMLAESQWLFTERELLQTPSVLDGFTPEKERENRSKGVNFILQVGIMLKLPQITLATASVFLHRFYMRHSLKSFHQYEIGSSSLFLATKVEENCRKMKELVIACVRVAQKDPHKMVDEQDKEYWRWRDVILSYEDLMLEALCFDMSLDPPYKTLFEHLKRLGEQDNDCLRNAAWAFLNDSYLTMLCLLYPSRMIATSALYAAAKHCGVAFPDDEGGKPWWDVIGVDINEIRAVCKYMADIYDGVPSKAGRGGGMYEQARQNDDEAPDKTRAEHHSLENGKSPEGTSLNGSLSTPQENGHVEARQVKRPLEDGKESEDNIVSVRAEPKETADSQSHDRDTRSNKRQKLDGDQGSLNGHTQQADGAQDNKSFRPPGHVGEMAKIDDTKPQPVSSKEGIRDANLKPDDEVSEEGEVEA